LTLSLPLSPLPPSAAGCFRNHRTATDAGVAIITGGNDLCANNYQAYSMTDQP
jgi:hypothetical protein